MAHAAKQGHAGTARLAMRIQGVPTPPATPDDVPLSALDADVGAVHGGSDGKRKKQRKRSKKQAEQEEEEEDADADADADVDSGDNGEDGGDNGEDGGGNGEDDGEQVLPLNSSAHIQNQRELALSLDPAGTLACGYPDCTFVASPPCLMTPHLRLRHHPKRKAPFICEWNGCGVEFKSWSRLVSHAATHYRIAQVLCYTCGENGVPVMFVRDQAHGKLRKTLKLERHKPCIQLGRDDWVVDEIDDLLHAEQGEPTLRNNILGVLLKLNQVANYEQILGVARTVPSRFVAAKRPSPKLAAGNAARPLPKPSTKRRPAAAGKASRPGKSTRRTPTPAAAAPPVRKRKQRRTQRRANPATPEAEHFQPQPQHADSASGVTQVQLPSIADLVGLDAPAGRLLPGPFAGLGLSATAMPLGGHGTMYADSIFPGAEIAGLFETDVHFMSWFVDDPINVSWTS